MSECACVCTVNGDANASDNSWIIVLQTWGPLTSTSSNPLGVVTLSEASEREGGGMKKGMREGERERELLSVDLAILPLLHEGQLAPRHTGPTTYTYNDISMRSSGRECPDRFSSCPHPSWHTCIIP